MTESRANEILRTKYPEATIFRRNSMGGTSSSALAVIFKPNGKVYDYQGASYQQVLSKLGFSILYKHDIKNMQAKIDKLQKLIDDGGEPDYFHLFSNDKWHIFTQEEIANIQSEIASIKTEISNSIIC